VGGAGSTPRVTMIKGTLSYPAGSHHRSAQTAPSRTKRTMCGCSAVYFSFFFEEWLSEQIPSHVTSCVTVRHICDGPYSAHPSRHMSHHLIRCDRCDGATEGWQCLRLREVRASHGGGSMMTQSGTLKCWIWDRISTVSARFRCKI
jgi:hypothetical protein